MSNLCRARLNTCSHGNRNPAMRQRAAVTMRAAAEQTMTVSAKMAQLRADGRTAMIPFICAGAALSDDCANSNHEQPLRQKIRIIGPSSGTRSAQRVLPIGPSTVLPCDTELLNRGLTSRIKRTVAHICS